MSNPVQDNSQEIVTKIQDGDKKAECALIDKYYKTLFFIILKQTNDHCLTQDICQEAFIIVLQKARNGGIKNSQAMGSFIRSVGVNLIIEYKRKLKRQKTDLSDSFEHLSDLRSGNAVSQLERENAVALVKQVLNELKNHRDRVLLREYFVYGKAKEEICIELDLSAEHFDKVLYRARQRFKQLLALQLNLDTSSVVTHLVSVALVCALTALTATKSPLMESDVRDILSSCHYVHNDTTYCIDVHSDDLGFRRMAV